MRSRLFIAVAAAIFLCLAGIAGIYAYDQSKAETLAKGVKVAGVDIGGLSASAARTRVRTVVRREIRRPIVVRWHGRRFVLHAKTVHIRSDVDGAVDAALVRSRDGSILTRTSRNLRGASIHVNIEPQIGYSKGVVSRLVATVAHVVDQAPQEARVAFAVSGPSIQRGRVGRTLQRERLRRAVEAALAGSGPRRIRAPVSEVKPRTSTATLAARYPTIIVVDRSSFHLSLYKDLRLQKTYTVAVGQQGLETPAGLYHILDKQVNPSWHVPNSAWAGSLAGQIIPPGPDDPIKARWMAVYNGAGIHGTDELYSLGQAASHGCIRMAIPDVIELYDETPLNTPVYIA
jgi:lipoprotein-anchoring transpeptidase ErfK/SrfK